MYYIHGDEGIKSYLQTLENAQKEKFHVIQKPVPAVALGNRKVCFLFHSDYQIIELLQR